MKSLGVVLAFVGTLLAISLLLTWNEPMPRSDAATANLPVPNTLVEARRQEPPAATGLIPISPLGTADKPASKTLAWTASNDAAGPVLAPIAKAEIGDREAPSNSAGIPQAAAQSNTEPNTDSKTKPESEKETKPGPEHLMGIESKITEVTGSLNTAAKSTRPVTPPKVFVFWEPFNTRAAATGFANTLTAMADIPLEVITEPKIGGRQYRVVLPFRDEAERKARIDELQAATGFQVR